ARPPVPASPRRLPPRNKSHSSRPKPPQTLEKIALLGHNPITTYCLRTSDPKTPAALDPRQLKNSPHPPASSSPHTSQSNPLPGLPDPPPSANADSSFRRYAE